MHPVSFSLTRICTILWISIFAKNKFVNKRITLTDQPSIIIFNRPHPGKRLGWFILSSWGKALWITLPKSGWYGICQLCFR